ncbi:MAG TPA: M48 family metalloprotease [Solirubrobacter sp.]|nr:M48 family metalloprotease [Solirubrobacter sp.]
MRARRDLFGTDLGLVLRMAVVAVATPLVVLAGLVAVLVWMDSLLIRGVVLSALALGACAASAERAAAARRGRALGPAEAPEPHAIVERLCVLADIPKPALVLESTALPNSWIEGTTRGGFRLHLTQGLLDTLPPRELEAVIAHELAHVINRDAAVMTVVGGPAGALLSGGVRVAGQGWWPFVIGGGIAALIGWVGSRGTRALSRYREFAADAGAVALTGSPAALASALLHVSDGLAATPRADLRAAAAQDAFHLLPVARERAYGLPPTHPSLKARIERLERLERTLQS